MARHMTYTERTWGIDLISEITRYCQRVDKRIKSASGENGLKTDAKQTAVFPDVILMGEEDRVIMGWELKLPDTSSDDPETIENATMKAERLGTNSFLIWNVSHAHLWVKENDVWLLKRSWTIPEITKRSEVQNNRSKWVNLLIEILDAINDLAAQRAIRESRIEIILGEPTYSLVLEEHAAGLAKLFLDTCKKDRVFDAEVREWALESTTVAKATRRREEEVHLLAQVNIVNWLNKILFCHYLKNVSEDAYEINDVNEGASHLDFLALFANISENSDFRSIFSEVLGQQHMTESLLSTLHTVNNLLKDLTASNAGAFDLTACLQSGLDCLNGKSRGQFSTPPLLANLLTRVTIRNLEDPVLDPCCGSGTIIREAADQKAELMTAETVSASVWASDKFSIPVGFTGIALANPDAMNEVQQVFRSDVAELRPGQTISFIDPELADSVDRQIPKFGAIVSNLPFIRFENIAKTQDLAQLIKFAHFDPSINGDQLPKRSDLYAYIILGLDRLVSDEGRIGVIVSNSWINSEWGRQFQKLLFKRYELEFVIVSGKGRWFQNAEVITSILVLKKRKSIDSTNSVNLVQINRPISEWTDTWVADIATKILTKRSNHEVTVTPVKLDDLMVFINNGLYWPGIGGRTNLVHTLLSVTTPLSSFLDIGRGARPGWEDMFFIHRDDAPSTGIEASYLTPMYHQPGRALKDQTLSGCMPNYFFFTCSASKEELEELGHTGALRWIEAFEHQNNSVGKPLPSVLRGRPHWYTQGTNCETEFLLTLNPDSTLPFYKVPGGSAKVSQRFLTFKVKENQFVDRDLLFALANSSISYLWQELIGFPKGAGALDRTANSLEKYWRIPNPDLITDEAAAEIKNQFLKVSTRKPLAFQAEFQRSDRQKFDNAVLNALGCDCTVEEVQSFLMSLSSTRRSVNL